jgi:cell wall-associated NlpC family hydrolase
MSRWFCLLLLLCAASAYAAPDELAGPPESPPLAFAQWNAAPAEAAQPDAPDALALLPASRWQQMREGVTQGASTLISTAMGFIGTPYRRGGSSATTGFDCSGFVRAIYEQAKGLALPHRAREQAAVTTVIDKKDLQPGDLVFFNTMRRAFSHVGMYLGNGKFIHAPRSGERVRVEDLYASYWQRRFNGARRVMSSSTALSAALN